MFKFVCAIASLFTARAEVEIVDAADSLLGLVKNEKYDALYATNFMKHDYPYRNVFRVEKVIEKLKTFEQPPAHLLEELRNDTIVDKWEVDKDCSSNSSLCNQTYDQPVIGILTQPVAEGKKGIFNYTDYILEINDNFVRWGGSKTVAIPYNISETDLYSLLRQINGVLFTGGGL